MLYDPATVEACAKVVDRRAEVFRRDEDQLPRGVCSQALEEECEDLARAIRSLDGREIQNSAGATASPIDADNPSFASDCAPAGTDRRSHLSALENIHWKMAVGAQEIVFQAASNEQAVFVFLDKEGASYTYKENGTFVPGKVREPLDDTVKFAQDVLENISAASPAPQPVAGLTGRVDYRKFAEWVGLSGSMPDDAALALYLEIELENREEITDAVEAAVMREAIEALRERHRLTSSPVSEEELSEAICAVPVGDLWKADCDKIARALLSQFSIGRK